MLNYNQKDIGTRIQMLRKSSDLTQEQLAEILNISTSTLGKLERGCQGASLDLIIDIAAYFGESLDYIILGKKLYADLVREQLHDITQKLAEVEAML